MKKDFLKPSELATQLGVTTGRVYQLLDAGTIPHIRSGRSIKVRLSDWERWLTQQQPRRMAEQPVEYGTPIHLMWREFINLACILAAQASKFEAAQTNDKGYDIE